MAARGRPAFLGRSRECREIDSALGRVQSGASAVLVLRGEAGVGKTALLEHCAQQAQQARSCRVARVAGVESELEMPFAALLQLCGPMLPDVETLPEPQEKALQVAFGTATGPTPDRFVVGLGVLSMLADISAKDPMVCLIDDAQWLDEASTQVLAFVSRRLLAESVLLLIAVRETGNERRFPGVPELTIEGLTDDDARALLQTTSAGHLDPGVRDRLIAETGGHPLALLELVGEMSDAELSGGFVAAHTLAGTSDLQEHYIRRIRALPDDLRLFLLIAAADATGDTQLLWRAAQVHDLGPRHAATAADAELLEIGSSVRFRHPLIRWAAYAAATDDDRHAVHLAIAAATDDDTDPDRRVWHLAAAAAGPDEDLATQLERLADKAQARAGVAAAATFLQRSVALTSDPGKRADRAVAAAHANLHAGRFDAGLGLLAGAEVDAVDDLQRARVEQLRAEIIRAWNSGSQAPLLLLEAAQKLESLDLELAGETYLDAWGAALVAGTLAAPGGDLRDVSTSARAALIPAGQSPAGDLLGGLATLILDGPGQAAPVLRRAVNGFLADEVSAEQWLHGGTLAANAALSLWDFDAWSAVSTRHIELTRALGALAPLASALNVQRAVATWRGDLERATLLGAEEDAVKEVTQTRRASYGALFVAAYQGRPEIATPLIGASADEAEGRGEGLGLQIADRATALLNLGLGHYADARLAAERAAEGCLGPFTTQALPDLVEAAARSGDEERARAALDQLSESANAVESNWAAGVEARSRALLSEGDEAERCYLDSIEELSRTPLRLELARAHLVYGEWLRREGRRIDARHQLRSAHEIFAAAGTEAFAERARQELLATGEKVRKRRPDTLNQLTPQEEHIARLARDGLSNPEIGAELFISARTVEWHLRKVYSKLGIASRRGLRQALPAR
jgi:DNA-binding CsgD family transcriptional regulator